MSDDQTTDVAAVLARVEAQLATLAAGQDERLIGTVRALAKLYCLAAVEDALARVRMLEGELKRQRRAWAEELSEGPAMFRSLLSPQFTQSLGEAA